MKLLTIIIFILLSLSARENPFFPSNKNVEIPLTSNQTKELLPLNRVTLTFPSTARTIESITIEYKNLDGSISKKKEIIQNSIDWHLPLVVSQSYEQIQNKLKIKSVSKFKNIFSLKFVKLDGRDKELKMITKDKMIRNFLLTKPHRIVCDLKRDIDFRSYEKEILSKSIVKKIRVGNHKGYYRIVIELDGYYKYETKIIKDGYLFTFL